MLCEEGVKSMLRGILDVTANSGVKASHYMLNMCEIEGADLPVSSVSFLSAMTAVF